MIEKSINLLKEVFTESWRLIHNNIKGVFYLAAIMFLISILDNWFYYNSSNFNQLVISIEIILQLTIDFLIYYIFTKALLKLDTNKKLVVSNLNLRFSEGFRYYMSGILYVVLIIVGLLLLIIPGVYFAVKYFFVGYTLLDKNLSIKQAFDQSAKLTEKRKLILLPIIILICVPGIVNSLLLSKFLSWYIVDFISIIIGIFLIFASVVLYRKVEARKV